MGRNFPFDDAFLTPRHLLALFLAIVLAPTVALIYMGWQLTEKDRALEEQRLDDRRVRAMELIVVALQQKLYGLEQRLGNSAEWPRLRAGNVRVIELGIPQRLPEASPEVFQAGENAEHGTHDYPAAIATFQKLAASDDAVVRAGALLGLARNLKKASRLTDALKVYTELEKLGKAGNVGVSGGLPADLVARRARCDLLHRMDLKPELEREATQLATDLDTGRWLLDGTTYSLHRRDVAQWLHDRTPFEVTETLFKEWEGSRHSAAGMPYRLLSNPEGGSTLLISRSVGERLVIFMAEREAVENSWLAELRPLLDSQGVTLALRAPGEVILHESTQQTTRTASDTGLPWTLSVSSLESGLDVKQSRDTRRLMLAGLGLLLVLVLAASYFVARVVYRELQIARLQSDFVATVSHEFRTPLTALRQVTEILNEGRVQERDKLNEYHQNQGRATERLQRLVERLLDFGRMEAGTKPYRMQPVEMSRWVRDVVEDFQSEAASHGHQIELHVNGDPFTVDADSEALAHALRNLLDNAVKYSPGSDRVLVDVAFKDAQCIIRVRDSGLGIPAGEQREIFRKFVRGSAAKSDGIQGTGVGLSIVQHIVEAHHGRIHVESQPGKGSTFSMVLPQSRS